MLKKTLTIVLLILLTGHVYAGVIDWCETFSQNRTRESCEACGKRQNAPEYYCDCHFGDRLRYGLDTIIADTTWFYAYVGDVSQNGINGYWFGDSALVLDFFIQCTQTAPMVSKTLNGNYNLAITPEEFSSYSELANVASNMKMYIRASVRNRGTGPASGRMIGLTTKQGLNATCQTEQFPVMLNCKSVLNDEVENVYEWGYKKMSPYYRNRRPHILFKRKRDFSAIRTDMELYITKDSCNGPIVAQTVLRDSTHAYFMDTLLMKEQYQNRKSLFLHLIPHPNTSAANISKGKVLISTRTKFQSPIVIDTTICYGKGLQIADTTLTELTIYTDTIALAGDSAFAIKRYNLTILSPEPIDTTLYWKQADLNRTYFDNWTKFSHFGEQEIFYREYDDGECAVAYRVNVIHDWDTVYAQTDSTICKGRVIKLNNTSYTNDTTILIETTSADRPDELKYITYRLTFTEPDLERDTVYASINMLPYNYHGTNITDFGTQEIYLTNTNPNECDRRVQLTCLRANGDIQTITETIDTTLCKGKNLYIGNQVISSNGTYEESISIDSLTILKRIYNVTFETLPIEYDTIYTSSLPIEYEGQTINGYGQTGIRLENPDECHRRIILNVIYQAPEIEYTYNTIDTTLCTGQSITLGGTIYKTDAAVLIETHLTEYHILQTTYNLHFTSLPDRTETIELTPEELPTVYEGQDILTFGEYEFEIMTDEGCLQKVYLIVNNRVQDNLETVSLSHLELHPTLTNTGEIITFTASADGVLTITDMLGRVVLTEQVLTGEHHFSLPQQGNYIVKYQTCDSLQTARVVIK